VGSDRRRPTEEDRLEAIRLALSGIAAGDVDDLALRLDALHPKNDTFPGEVLLELAADAIEDAGASRERPIEFENIRTRYLPEGRAHTKAEHHKAEFAIRAAAMIRAGVDPDLLGEVSWWRTDDFFVWALDALIIYVRAAAERLGEPVDAVCARLAAHHGVELSASR
jgi:hypothetical protein